MWTTTTSRHVRGTTQQHGKENTASTCMHGNLVLWTYKDKKQVALVGISSREKTFLISDLGLYNIQEMLVTRNCDGEKMECTDPTPHSYVNFHPLIAQS